MAGWIISVCGVALLTVLCDVILPDGNTKKYVRAVIGVVLSFAMLLPVTNFFEDIASSGVDLQGNMVIQQQYVDGREDQKNLARIQKVNNVMATLSVDYSITLESNDYVCVRVACNEQTLVVVQNALSAVEDKITVIWRNSGG